MRLRTVVLATAIALSATACSQSYTPVPIPSTSQQTQDLPAATASAQASKPASTPKHPWMPGEFQKGIQLYWHSIGSSAAITSRANSLLDYVVGLGANSVGITFSIYTNGAYPSGVYAGPDTPTPSQLALVLAAAKKHGLHVMLRPTINEVNIAASKPGAWRGSIEPQNAGSWFASYDKLLLSYASVAQQYRADEFVAGVELFSLQQYTDEWASLQRQFRADGYAGVLSYSLNWDNSADVPFKTLGVDAYPAIDLGDDASTQQLAGALTSWLEERPASLRSQLTIQETGIPALSGMYPHPWLWGTGGGTQNFSVQAKWFAAMCIAAKASHVQGIYYWSLDSSTDLSAVNAKTEYSGAFVGRPAAASIKQCFS